MNNVGELVRARELRLAIYHGGNSQNFLGKFVKKFLTLGLKILKQISLKGGVNYVLYKS